MNQQRIAGKLEAGGVIRCRGARQEGATVTEDGRQTARGLHGCRGGDCPRQHPRHRREEASGAPVGRHRGEGAVQHKEPELDGHGGIGHRQGAALLDEMVAHRDQLDAHRS